MKIRSAFLCSGILLPLLLSTYWASARTIQFGDLHSHTAYSDDAYDIQTKDLDYLQAIPPRGALDFAKTLLDFVAITDHAEQLSTYPLNSTNEFADIKTQCLDSQTNGPLTAFAGFEFTRTGKDEDGNDVVGAGHKQVVYLNGTSRIQAISAVLDKPTPGSPHASNPTELWQQLDADGAAYITIPHHPSKGTSAVISPETDMSTDWSYVNGDRQPVVEVFSIHGSSDFDGCLDPVDGFRADRSVESALNRWLLTGNNGYRLGLIASTDNHGSRPGSTEESLDATQYMVHGEGDYTGGLIGAWSDDNNRETIWAALNNRRVYATSGQRIKIHDFSIRAGNDSAYMGDLLFLRGSRSTPAALRIEVETDNADLESIIVTRITTADVNASTATLVNTSAREWVKQTSSSHGYAQTWTNKSAILEIPDVITTGRTYYRVTVYQQPTDRWTWNASIPHWRKTTTKERAWSSPIFINSRPSGSPGSALLLLLN